MSAYLITGSSGVGKSAVIEELASRGFVTFADEINVTAKFFDRKARRFLSDYPPHPIDLDRYVWDWDIPALTKLLAHSPNPTFVGGVCANTTSTFPLYKAVFVLLPSVNNLKHRLRTRTDNNFGKHPDELAHILATFDETGDAWRKTGAQIIDADQPAATVADDILAHIKVKEAAV